MPHIPPEISGIVTEVAQEESIGLLRRLWRSFLRAVTRRRQLEQEVGAAGKSIATISTSDQIKARAMKTASMALHEVSFRLRAGESAAGSVSTAYRLVLEGMGAVLTNAGPGHEHRSAVFIRDPHDPDWLRMHWSSHFGSDAQEKVRLPVASSLAGITFTTGKPYVCRDIHTDPYFHPGRSPGSEYLSVLCVAVGSGTETVAVLSVDGPERDYFTLHDVAVAEFYASVLGVILAVEGFSEGLSN